MKNVLVFSFFPAFTPPKSGGEVRLFNFYFELSKYFNITLISSSHLFGEHQNIRHNSKFLERRVPKDASFVKHWQRLEMVKGDGDLSGPCLSECGNDFTELHKIYLEEYEKAEIIVHDFPFTVDFDLFLGLDNKPRIYNSHNCEYSLYKKLHLSAPSNEIVNIVKRAELKLLKSANLVSYCGENDLTAFEEILGSEIKKSCFVPSGMTPMLHAGREINEKNHAVFIGSGHLPNVEAANYIVKKLAPNCANIIFDVIGNCLPEGNYPANVIRHGLVSPEDKNKIISNAKIAINPMLEGSGSSLKIMDFVSHGIAVLSTPIGLRGFDFVDGKHCLVADINDFANALIKNIKDNKKLNKINAAASLFAHENYSWASVVKRFADKVNTLFSCNHSVPKQEYVLSINDYNPFDTVGGGATRLKGIYEAISEWKSVVVLCFSNSQSIEIKKISEKIDCIAIPKTENHIQDESYYNSRFHISANDIVAIKHAGINELLNSVYDILRKQAIVISCEHPYMVALPDRYGDQFVYSSQNCELSLKRSLLEWHPDKDELINILEFAENLSLASSARVIAVSEEDATQFTIGTRACAPIVVIPNGAAIPIKATPEDVAIAKEKVATNSVLFLGSAHMPNVESAKYIVDIIAKNCPDVNFHIIGSVCEALQAPLPENVIVWGTLSDSMKSAVMGECTLAINPIFSGSGSNVKLADMLANGLHVITTAFGARGYPASINPHITVVEATDFSKVINEKITIKSLNSIKNVKDRKGIFKSHLSMKSIAAKYINVIQSIQKPRKKILFVTYRYISPILGGGELMLNKLITELDKSNEFNIDVIAPEISAIDHIDRFKGKYFFDQIFGAPANLENVRYFRFPLNPQIDDNINNGCEKAWLAQSEFEKNLYLTKKVSVKEHCLAWGWGSAEGENQPARWSFTHSGLELSSAGQVKIKGYNPNKLVLLAIDLSGRVLYHSELETYYEITFNALQGVVELYFSSDNNSVINDVRPLASYVQAISINDEKIDFGKEIILHDTNEDSLTAYNNMYSAYVASRLKKQINLTEIRGPHSDLMDKFIVENINAYDMVLTHNSVLRPATFAVKAAKEAEIPSLLIPHAHLDDDYYHFTDVHQAALDASLVLASPKAACDFYKNIGVKNLAYLPAGIDDDESFNAEDIAAFKALYKSEKPFFLVLGRKSQAKGYLDVIKSTEKLAKSNQVHLIMIGPDDDGIQIVSQNVTYLGIQPREVVRGALQSCVALINMSQSESFGIVLLEAWMASRPVIVNSQCSAFLDLAEHNKNGLLTNAQNLVDAMQRLLQDPKLCESLGKSGKKLALNYSWEKIGAEFVTYCKQLCENKTKISND